MKQFILPTLYIDTTKNNEICVGLYKDKGQKMLREKIDNYSSQKLLPLIEKLLKQEQLDLKKLKAIKVEVGPGSFTGTRVGVSVANALGWSLNIPVNDEQIVLPSYSTSKFD